MFDCLANIDNGTVQFGIGCIFGRRVISKVYMHSDTDMGFEQDQVCDIGINICQTIKNVVTSSEEMGIEGMLLNGQGMVTI